MKIRQGFVSNSSSSSFIVAVPNTSPKLSKKLLFEVLGVPRTSPMFSMANELADIIMTAKEYDPVADGAFDSYEDFCEGLGFDEMMIENSKFYEFSASSEGDPGIESYLYESGFSINTPELKIVKWY